MKNKEKLTPKTVFAKFCQFIYLSASNFTKNNLWESAASCSFGFVFSFIPITLIIITFLVTFLRVSPNVLNYVFTFADEIKSVVDITPVINNLLQVTSIKFMDIFLAVWVIWMARKMFLSIIQAMTRIFGSVSRRKSVFNQFLTFVSEFTLVLIFVAVILVTFVLNRILSLPIFEYILNSFPRILRQSSNVLVVSVMYTMLFLYVLYAYKFVSGTKPQFRKCVFYAAMNTGTFFIFSFFINKFLNVTNYNVIYGTISTLVVLMMKVYFFFMIFLFYAQMIYVSQFFDNLLLAEMYLLPSEKTTVGKQILKQINFFNPAVTNIEFQEVNLPKYCVIYNQGDKTDKVYYLKKGAVTEKTDFNTITYESGTFFGEISFVIHQNQNGTAITTSECQLLIFSADTFKNLLRQNPLISAYTLRKLNKYTEFKDPLK